MNQAEEIDFIEFGGDVAHRLNSVANQLDNILVEGARPHDRDLLKEALLVLLRREFRMG